MILLYDPQSGLIFPDSTQIQQCKEFINKRTDLNLDDSKPLKLTIGQLVFPQHELNKGNKDPNNDNNNKESNANETVLEAEKKNDTENSSPKPNKDETSDNNDNKNNDGKGSSNLTDYDKELIGKLFNEQSVQLNKYDKLIVEFDELKSKFDDILAENTRLTGVVAGYRTQMEFLQERLKTLEKPKDSNTRGINGRRQSKVMVVKTKISAEIQREARKIIQYTEVSCALFVFLLCIFFFVYFVRCFVILFFF